MAGIPNDNSGKQLSILTPSSKWPLIVFILGKSFVVRIHTCVVNDLTVPLFELRSGYTVKMKLDVRAKFCLVLRSCTIDPASVRNGAYSN